jgi:hypothetical protein
MVERKVGPVKWKEVQAKLLGLPLEIVDADQELVSEIKATHKMS